MVAAEAEQWTLEKRDGHGLIGTPLGDYLIFAGGWDFGIVVNVDDCGDGDEEWWAGLIGAPLIAVDWIFCPRITDYMALCVSEGHWSITKTSCQLGLS